MLLLSATFFEESVTFVPTASKKIVSVPDISAVNLIEEWKLFAFKRNSSILSLFVSHFVQGHPTTVFSQMLF